MWIVLYYCAAGPSLTHGRRQFPSSESSAIEDDVDESVVRRKRRAITHTSDGDAARPGRQLEIVPSFVGQAITPTNIFGVLFPNRSYPLDASNFTQVDSQKWLLNMDIFVGEFAVVHQICVEVVQSVSVSNLRG